MKKLSIILILLLVTGGVSAQLDFFSSDKGKVAIIQLEGAISSSSTPGTFGGTSISPEKVRELNSRAKDQNADAIIYEWNSGGGAVVASKEVMRSIEAVEMPTVCRFRDVAASGAYLASLGCDRIVADSASITGSIGVKSSYLEFSGLLEKLGVEYVNITAGQFKDIGSRYTNISEEEKKILQEKADLVHKEFTEEVREERNLTEEEMENISTGEIFLGTEAKKNGLVDILGGRVTAVRQAEVLTGKELETFAVEKQPEFNLLKMFLSGSIAGNFIDTGSPLKAIWR